MWRKRVEGGRPGAECAFRCLFQTSLSDYDDGGLHVAAYEGEIFAFVDEDCERLAGHARLFVLNAQGAQQDGQSLFNLLDMREETAAFIPLLGEEEGQLAPAVCQALGEATGLCNMLLLDRLELLPGWTTLEADYLRAVILRFGVGCRLAAARRRDARARRVSRAHGLQQGCLRSGFVCLPRSDLMILDLSRQLVQRMPGRRRRHAGPCAP